jgi:hypothetical protein
MKIAIEVAEDLLERAAAAAQRKGITLGALEEEGLHLALEAREDRTHPSFELQTFKGDGMTPEFHDAGWEQIREAIYVEPFEASARKPRQ